MKLSDSGSRPNLIDVLVYLMKEAPDLEDLSSADFVLFLCGTMLGTLLLESSSNHVGPVVMEFLSRVSNKPLSSVAGKIQVLYKQRKPVSKADINALLEEVRQSKLESELSNAQFQLEMRNLLTRLDILPNLVAQLPERMRKLVIEAMNSQIDLLTVHTVALLSDVAAQHHSLVVQTESLLQQVTQAQGARTGPHEPIPPIQHVFISYAHADGDDLARRLHDSLESDEIDTWLDRYDIKPGDEWDETIQKAIEDCRLFVLIVTPSSVQSKVCKNEYMHALRTKKKIVCAIYQDAPIPFLLNTKQYIDFRSNFKHALAQLRLALSLDRDEFPIGPEQTLQQELRALEQIKIEVSNRSTNPKAHSKFINAPPLDVSDLFIGRVKQQKDIVMQLREKRRLISIYGRAGVGKTALACKVLSDLQTDQEDFRIDGMIYLSADTADTTSKGISPDRLFADFLKLLNDDARSTVEATLLDSRVQVKQKVTLLLNELSDGCYILLLDNLETLQNPETGELTNSDLQTFFETALEQNSGLRIIVTSRIQLVLSSRAKTREYQLLLEDGLPPKDAIQLLCMLDASGTAGLRGAPREKLRSIAEKTRGFPRALVAVVSLLMMDKLTSLDDLLNRGTLLVDKVTEVIVQQAIIRLTPNLIRILETIALLGHPTTETELRFLLASYMDVNNLYTALNQLVGAHFVEYNKVTRKFSLHPIDREYCYHRIPEGSLGDRPTLGALPAYTRYALHYLAADYYARSRTLAATWKSIDDLEPQLLEFEHRLKAEDYDTAAKLVDDIDFNYLTLWGHARQVLTMRESLLGKIKERRLQGTNLGYLGHAYCTIGQFGQAIDYSEQALHISREVGDLHMQATNLTVLGECYRVGGEYALAIRYLDEAMIIAGKLGDSYNELKALYSLGVTYRNIGDYEKSVKCHRQALPIARKSNDRPGESHNLLSLGVTYHEMGQVEQAIDCYQQALDIVHTTNDKERESDTLGNLGIAHRVLGQHEQAAKYFQQALEVALNFHRRWEGIWLGNLGVVYDCLGEYEQAVKCEKESLAIMYELEERRSVSFSLARLGKTYLVMGHLDDALDALAQAFEIATQIGNPRDRQSWGTIYAEGYLYKGQLDGASKIIADIRRHDVPENNHYAAVLDGLIKAKRNEQEAARVAFNEAIAYSNKLLVKTPRFYAAQYTRGLALTALALLSRGEEKMAFFIQAEEAYHYAYLNCHSPGVVKEALCRLHSLQSLDEDGILTRIESILHNTL